MHLIKVKTRILLMSKYFISIISVQDRIYTIQTLLEVSESDFTTEKVKSSNDIEINVTLMKNMKK